MKGKKQITPSKSRTYTPPLDMPLCPALVAVVEKEIADRVGVFTLSKRKSEQSRKNPPSNCNRQEAML